MANKRPAFTAIAVILLMSAVATIATAAPESYRLGTDDVIVVSVWDNKELEQTTFVRPDGKISLSLIGEIQAGGRTIAELAAEITEGYRRTIKEAEVSVSLREIRSRAVFFFGGVAKPGPLQLTRDLTLLQALSAVGGLLPTAALENAFLIRGEQRVAVNFLDLVQRGDVSQNIRVQPGDTIVVPNASFVFIQGEVKNPGAIPFAHGMTVLKAIAYSGGMTPAAAGRRVVLITENGQKKETVKINVGEIIAQPDKVEDTVLKPNDIIIVPQRLF